MGKSTQVGITSADLMEHGNSRNSGTFHTGLNTPVVFSRRGWQIWRHGPAHLEQRPSCFSNPTHHREKMAGRLSRHLIQNATKNQQCKGLTVNHSVA